MATAPKRDDSTAGPDARVSEKIDIRARNAVAKGFIHPLWIAAFFLLAASLAYFFGVPERWTAPAVLIFFAAITFANPVNGAAFMVLGVPFFLGETGWPWYWIAEAMVLITLASTAFHAARWEDAPRWPIKRAFTILIAASAASIPIDGREFVYDAWAASIGDIFAWWLAGHPAPKTHYLRVLTNMASGAVLFYLAFAMARGGGPKRVQKLFEAMTYVAGAVCAAGILMACGLMPADQETWRYLTMSLVGNYGGSITAFAYALHFFNQYLLLALPAALYSMFINRANPLSFAISAAAAALMAFCVIQGGLRTSAAVLYMILIFAAGLYVYHLARGRKIRMVYPAAALMATAAAIAGYALAGGLAFHRLHAEVLAHVDSDLFENIGQYAADPLYFMKHGILEPRFFLWHTAVLMFASSPLLGVGLGRYTAMFREYYASGWYNWEDIGFASGATAHSFYFETLADQGIVGVIAWGMLIGGVIAAGAGRLKAAGGMEDKTLVIAALAPVAVFLLLGVTHYLFLSRAIEIFFWIQFGLLAGLCADHLPQRWPGKGAFAVTLAFIAAAFLYQVRLAAERPIPESYSAGFYNWERLPEEGRARWSGRRAVMKIAPAEGRVILPMSAPTPCLGRKPQKVTMWLDGHKEEVIFNDTGWKDVMLPSVEAKEGAMLWLEADYVCNPKEEGASADGRNLGAMLKDPRREER